MTHCIKKKIISFTSPWSISSHNTLTPKKAQEEHLPNGHYWPSYSLLRGLNTSSWTCCRNSYDEEVLPSNKRPLCFFHICNVHKTSTWPLRQRQVFLNHFIQIDFILCQVSWLIQIDFLLCRSTFIYYPNWPESTTFQKHDDETTGLSRNVAASQQSANKASLSPLRGYALLANLLHVRQSKRDPYRDQITSSEYEWVWELGF
jgi:hypothetical protein